MSSNVQLYGNQNRVLKLTVGRDGHVNLPDLGPINVGGQRFTSVKADIESRVERQMIGVRASVSMGDTRSIRVFVLGEAQAPGLLHDQRAWAPSPRRCTRPGASSGSARCATSSSSARGALVRRLDLYDLLIRGDTKDDAKLLQGDVIFIPPVGATVSIDGEVRRPAIYEIRNESTVADLVQLGRRTDRRGRPRRRRCSRASTDEPAPRRDPAGRPVGRRARRRRCATAICCACRACGRRSTRAFWCRVTCSLRGSSPGTRASASRTSSARWMSCGRTPTSTTC